MVTTITLENIQIEFDKCLIRDSAISIYDSSVTVITGKSGSGKTSLLYMIGLISTNANYQYCFDGSYIQINSDKDVSNTRKQKIGYIFQDNSLIDCLTVRDNIRNSAKIAGLSITDAQINEYLNTVQLNINPNVYPKVLSGGEQQRLAIACAMAKQPDLLIADEPTSSLDMDNTKVVMDILRAYARSGKKVVIASHSTIVCDYADYIYDIAYNKIILKKSPCIEQVSDVRPFLQKRSRFSPLFLFQYSAKAFKKGWIQKTVMVFLCAISIAFAANISSLGDGFVDYQNSLMNGISERQIFVINSTAPIQTYVDIDEHLSLTDDAIKKITGLNSIDTYYPYFEFRSIGYDYSALDFFSSTTVTVQFDNETHEYIFDSNMDGEYSSIIIVPYYPEDTIENRVVSSFVSNGDSSNGIFVSYQLSRLLNLDDRNGKPVGIQLDLGVPLYTTNIELAVSDTSSTYSADIDVSVLSCFDFQISGILDYNYINSHSASGDNIIYVPVERMLEYLSEAQSAHPEHQKVNGISFNSWNPSAYVVYVKSYNDIKPTSEKIESIDPNLKAISEYQDVVSMNEMISNIKSTASSIIVVVLLIVLILMMIIYINNTLNRKFEIAVLKANGLNKLETFGIVTAEAFIHLLLICVISILATILTGKIINLLFSFDIIQFSQSSISTILGISTVSILTPTISSVLLINQFKPDKIMRN